MLERKPIRFCARHEEEMIDPGERDCLGAEMSPCDGSTVEYVPAEQLASAVEARTREIMEALRLEGYIYDSYGPRAADFIQRCFEVSRS